MGTYIVIAILIIVVVFAMRSTMKHMRGEGGCCGGGSVPRVKKQRIKQSIATKRIVIGGMTCDNCRKRVENSLNALNHVNARVSLKCGMATVKLEKYIADEVLRETIENVGYKVISIEEICKK